jgi:ferredoxin--NADP+ reductase
MGPYSPSNEAQGFYRAARKRSTRPRGSDRERDAVAAREYDRAMDNGRAWRVAIVGAGPSAFYAAEAVFKQAGDTARIDVFERLPTPFGLVRHGVAPDHQNIKAVVRIYDKVAATPGFRFVGNAALGRDFDVAELAAHYDQIVYAFGCASSQRLGVHAFDLARARRVAVVGNGNVALDVARILLAPPDALAATDIAPSALAALRGSAVQEVLLLGRRSVAEASYAPKELAEIAELPGVDVVIAAADAHVDDASRAWLAAHGARSQTRNVDFAAAQSGRGDGDRPRKLRLRFRVAPAALHGRDGRLVGMALQPMALQPGPDGAPRARPDGPTSDVAVDLLLVAIGYRGGPVPGVPHDPAKGTVRNVDGRVVDEHGAARVGEYAVGWCKHGPVGLIGTNSLDAKEVVARMAADRAAGATLAGAARERDLVATLRVRGVDVVDWSDWQRLDAWEQREGAAHGAVRRKLDDVGAMMARIRTLRASAG